MTARGEDRLLLVLATGTGKTYTAFQIIWRLWKSGAKKRILFLVDRVKTLGLMATFSPIRRQTPFSAYVERVRKE